MAHLECQTLSLAEASKQFQATGAQNMIKTSLKNAEHILKERKGVKMKDIKLEIKRLRIKDLEIKK